MNNIIADIHPDRFRIAYRHILTLLIMLLFFFSLPAEAKKDKTNKKSKNEVVNLDYEPDQICRKAKPDSHPRPHEMPCLYGVGVGSGMCGIDVSHYQGKIDWASAANDSHVNFVYLKMTEGIDLVDNTYQHNLNEARRHGIKVGSYHFFRPNTSASSQFRNFKNVFDPRTQDLLPVVDVEVMPKGLAKSKFDSCLLELLKLIEKEYGKKPMIYTGQNFYNKHFHGTSFVNEYKFWIATYADDQPVLWGNDDYLIWQYSAKGRVKGIKGNVDMNKFIGRHTLREIMY